MKVVFYEWCSSGGLQSADARLLLPADGREATEEPLDTLVSEGCAMLAALVRDAAKDPALEATVLWDATRHVPPEWAAGRGRRCRLRQVPPGADAASLVTEAMQADWTVIVAPETGGLLADRVAAVRRNGGRPAACGTRFIALAEDKQATSLALAAAGVPVPAGRPLAVGEAAPEGFHLPAVRKLRDGVGCGGLEIVRTPAQAARPAHALERIEAFVTGVPVGVSCLCGQAGIVPLAAVVQRFTAGDRPRYQGGFVEDREPWCARAESLAVRAIDAVARAAGRGRSDAVATGWVGVDMMLGDDDDGRGDRVLEVNPRLTTSFVGLAARDGRSLVRRLLDAAAGLPAASPERYGARVEFDVTGKARVLDD